MRALDTFIDGKEDMTIVQRTRHVPMLMSMLSGMPMAYRRSSLSSASSQDIEI